jgi:hypothetical protein
MTSWEDLTEQINEHLLSQLPAEAQAHERELVEIWSSHMQCNQCEALVINGTFCHETGCPNTSARYDSESDTWIQQRTCSVCGYGVDEDDPCCNADCGVAP